MELSRLYTEFTDSEKSGGLVLVLVTALSLGVANSPWQADYINFWHIDAGGHSIIQWINDGLMTIFFLLIGLELERELYNGELADLRSATLPIIGALGGMLVPAGIFLLLNAGTETLSGAGIPMATDIAFAIGVLSLLGSRVPDSLKIFLLAVAIVDDLGAILIIGLFYTSSFVYENLLVAVGVGGLLIILNRMKIYNLIPYLVGGVAMWYFISQSGIHPTITGVLLALIIPFGTGGEKSPSFILQHILHKPVAFLILPLFAMANTCVSIGDSWQNIGQSNSLGIIMGLLLGKPLGIWLFSFVGVSIGLCALPTDLKWKNIIGAGFLAGIGFTMSIFITLLAFDDPTIVNSSKLAILIASLAAGIIGFIFLRLTLK